MISQAKTGRRVKTQCAMSAGAAARTSRQLGDASLEDRQGTLVQERGTRAH